MSNSGRRDRLERLGGRLALLDPSVLDEDQARLAERLAATRSARASRAGYRTVLDDGRLIGPFNAMLRAPQIGEAQLDLVEAISASGLPARVREVVILTVAAHWRCEYVLYAHRHAAVAAGLSEETAAQLGAGHASDELVPDEEAARQVVLGLVRDHDLSDDRYRDAIRAFGEDGVVTLLALIGHYSTTCAVATCFRVPAPDSDNAPE